MKILEIFRASPTLRSDSDKPPSPTSLPLTFFDILWLRLPPVERVFLYEFPHQATLFYQNLLPKLKSSLSLALDHYFPLAATLTWPQDSPKPIVIYKDGDAVSLTVAESDADFNHLAGTDLCEATQVRHLVPHLTISDQQAAVLALQVTLFPNSGFSIAITSHHAVLDGKTSTSFIKSWAYLCKKLQQSESESGSSDCSLPPELIPFLDRGVVKDSMGLDAKYLSDWLKEGGPNNRSLSVWDFKVPEDSTRGVFHLSRSQVERIKQIVVSKKKGDTKTLHLSTFVVSLAYAWVCRVKTEETNSRTSGMALNIDCRARLDPPITHNYLGNCISFRLASIEREKLMGEDGVVAAVEALSAALETLKEGVLNGSENWSKVLHDALHNTDVKVTGAAGSPRFEVYGNDFGWGRPKKVEMVSIEKTGAFCLSDTRDGDGVEIGFVSKKGAMEAFASLFVKGIASSMNE